MKKVILTILLSLLLLTPVMAIDLGGAEAQNAATKAGYNPNTGETTFAENVGLVIRIVLSFVGTFFLVLMVYAGYLWMTASGEEEKVKTAQKIIYQAIIGLIIVVGAYSITTAVVPAVVNYAATGSTDSGGGGLGGFLNSLF